MNNQEAPARHVLQALIVMSRQVIRSVTAKHALQGRAPFSTRLWIPSSQLRGSVLRAARESTLLLKAANAWIALSGRQHHLRGLPLVHFVRLASLQGVCDHPRVHRARKGITLCLGARSVPSALPDS